MGPMIWMVSMIAPCALGVSWLSELEWAQYVVFGLLIFVFLAFVSCYVYFMLRNPNALRSEKFVLAKAALDRGLVGDNRQGLQPIEPEEESSTLVDLGSDDMETVS